MSVSVVCLSFNRPHLLREALASIRAQSHPLAEVLVVDNRSERSDEVAAVVADFPEFTLLPNPTNRGYTGGMNAGLRGVSGDFVVLTEDDITLAPDAVRAVVERLTARPEVGIVGGLMLNKATGTIRCAGGEVELGSRFQMTVLGEGATDLERFAEPFEVTYLPGAFLAARRAVWERLGGFRELYFAYMEDVDLCLRAVRGGWALEVVPSARVWHADPPADARTPDWLQVLKLQNLLRCYLLNAPGGVLPAFLARFAVWELVRQPGRWNRLVAVARTVPELPSLLRERRNTLTPRSVRRA